MAKSTTDRPSMGDLIKQLPTTTTPIQEVRPVDMDPKPIKEVEDLARLSAMWVPADLARRLKIHAAESGMTIREIAIKVLNAYFSQITK